jgi:hypothetical protein
MPYRLLDVNGDTVTSNVPGLLGGNRRLKIYGRLDCPSARRALPNGYAKRRVFFADEATAIAAGYRPCAVCMPVEYRRWKTSMPPTGRTLRARRIRALGAAVALALCVARPSHAQSADTGRLEGTVTDSVHARPLAGVRVVAVGTDSLSATLRATTSDSAGRYHIDSLSAGRYVVGFESPLLDSLELTVSPREATLASGTATTLDLALPPAAKLRAALCPGVALPAGTGVIVGHVVSAESESPLPGTEIAMQWHDIGVVKQRRLRAISEERSASVITDMDGWYRVCGVPTGAWVSMQVQRGERTGSVIRTHVDDTLGIVVRHLSLVTGARTSTDSAAATSATDAARGTAGVNGVVVGPEGAPVPAAEVRVRGTRAVARTDSAGTFRLRGLPAGTQQLEVRRVGYVVAELPVELRSGTATTSIVRLQRITVNLDSVFIVATRPKYPDFYVHKSAGWGRFLGPEEIAKQRVARTSDIIEKIPGFVVLQQGYRAVVVGALGGAMSCPATIVIDGVRVPFEFGASIDEWHPTQIGAIEAYPAHMAFMAPPEFGNNPCGVVAIWTAR